MSNFATWMFEKTFLCHAQKEDRHLVFHSVKYLIHEEDYEENTVR